jgi:glycosyltransferase involved in cell wall biosynthesis
MNKISAVILCLNEESMIEGALESVKFADEILVVDSFSTDRTLEIARRYTDRILQHKFEGFAAQKNWAHEQATHDWVINVDADERVTPELATEIRQILQNPQHNAYLITRKNFFLGKEIRYGAWSGDKVLRLFRRDKARYPDIQIHSELVLEGEAGRCTSPMLHYSYRSLDDFVRRVQSYSGGGAEDAKKRGRTGSGWSIAGHSFWHFFKAYIVKRGFLDGTEGLIIAMMGSYYTFLKYGKLYEQQRASRTEGPH